MQSICVRHLLRMNAYFFIKTMSTLSNYYTLRRLSIQSGFFLISAKDLDSVRMAKSIFTEMLALTSIFGLTESHHIFSEKFLIFPVILAALEPSYWDTQYSKTAAKRLVTMIQLIVVSFAILVQHTLTVSILIIFVAKHGCIQFTQFSTHMLPVYGSGSNKIILGKLF